ncbi:MAG: sporulation protein [candidate division Zixibacteria bacterium]|nr:sporulation protein [candidate division Zixibacteria bacterium]
MPNQVEEIMRAIVGELKSMANSESIIGKPITVEGKLVVPICKMTVGFGAGGGEGEEKETRRGFGGGGGGGAMLEPVGFIIVVGEKVSLLPVKPGKTGEIIEMIPYLIDKIKGLKGSGKKGKGAGGEGKETEEDTEFQTEEI